jgi:tetratricopeptide (TPR) repeat protein
MKRQLFINLIIFLGSLALSEDLQSIVNKANNEIKSNDLVSAETLLQDVLDVDPSFAPARVALSKIWLRKGDLSKANEYANLAVRIDEDFRPWWEKLNEIRAGIQNGQKYVHQSDFDKAFDEYEAISEKFPYYSQAHYYMGIAKYKQKDFQQAALSFENALKIYPDYQKAIKALNNVKKRLSK